MNYRGQSMLELVFGIGLITIVVGAMTIVAVNTLRNTQFSKNQTQATSFARENLEKVRSIKASDFFICLQTQTYPNCSTWEGIWNTTFETDASGTCTSTSGCTFEIVNNPGNNPAVCPDITSGSTTYHTPFCLKYRENKIASGSFTYQIIIEDEGDLQKRVTSRVFWSDSSGEHSSDLVTILTRY